LEGGSSAQFAKVGRNKAKPRMAAIWLVTKLLRFILFWEHLGMRIVQIAASPSISQAKQIDRATLNK
jgi:hypothetical protein